MNVPLPPIIDELSAVIPLDACLALVRRWGGQVLWIPAKANFAPAHPLNEIGQEHAAALVAYYQTGGYINVPRCAALLQRARDAAILAARTDGQTRNAVAARFGITWRTVAAASRRAEKGAPAEDPTLDLFADL